MRRHTAATTLALFLLAAPATGQQPATTPKPGATPIGASSRMTLEISGGLGITNVAMSQWAGFEPNDWGTLAYSASARLLFPSKKSIRFGVEAGYGYDFWYNYFPGGTSFPYQIDVSGEHVAALVRLGGMTHLTADIGAGLYIFDTEGGTDPGILLNLAYHVPLSGRLEALIQLRSDAIFTSPVITPVTLNVGLGLPL